MAERGLFIDIEGEVSQKLLLGMERLKQKMDRLSRTAMRLSTTAKAAGHMELGRGLDKMSREAQEASDSITDSVDDIGNSIERLWTTSGRASSKALSEVAATKSKVKAAFRDVDVTAGREAEKAGKAKKLPDLEARRQLYQEYMQEMGNWRQAQKAAQKRSDELTDSVTRLYRSMYEAGAIDAGSETLEEFAHRVDYAKLRNLDLQKELKITKNGFENLSDEAKQALRLDDSDLELMTKRFTNLDNKIVDFNTRLQKVGSEIGDLDLADTVGVEQTKKRVSELQTELNRLSSPIKEMYGEDYFYEMERRVLGYKQAIADTKTQERELTREQRDRQKHLDTLDNLKRKIKEVDETDFEAIPEGQLPERLKEVRSFNRQLSQMRKHMSADEYDQFAEILSRNDKSLSKLVTTTQQYNKTGKRTNSLLARMWHAFDRMSHTLIRQIHLWGIVAVVTVGAQAAYAGLATWATKAAASISENAKKLNMSVESMQELQSAAVATGTSVKDMREALESLNTTVIEAIKGKEKAKEAFDELGIEFGTLVNKGNDTEAMFDLVMGKLDEVNSSAKRLSIAEDIFGEGPASTLVNLVGSVDEARETMKQFDIMMSQEATKSAEQFWNKIRGLWLVIKRQFISAAVQASDVMSNFADKLLEAAARGNLFEGTIVPAVKSTIGILKGLYSAGKVVYWILHRMYEAWNALIIPIKMLIGLGVVKFFNKITGGIQAYIIAMKGATTWAARFGIALRGVLRATGYYLIVEAIMWITSALQEASKVAEKTELTFKEAFAAIAETAVESLFNTMAQAMSELPSILKQTAVIIGQSIWDGILHGIITAPKNLSIRRIVFEKLMGGFEEESDHATDKSQEILKNFRKKANEALEGMDLFSGVKQSASESRAEMLKTAEVAEGAGEDIIGTVKDMAKEGRVDDVGQLIPFARTEVQDKIDETQKKLKEYGDYINTLRHPTFEIDDEILQKYEQLNVQLKELREEQHKLATDIPIKAELNRFQENMSNSMESAKLKFKEGSIELLQFQKQIIDTEAQKYRDLLNTAISEGASDQFTRQLKNTMLKAQNELAEKESEILEHRYNVIEKGTERNVQEVKNEMEQRSQLLDQHVAEGKKYEEDAALERAKAQEQASKEILEIRKNEVERIKNLLGENLAAVKMTYGLNSDQVKWFRETIQAKEEADQQHTEARIKRMERVQEKAEATFQREKELAEHRKTMATTGLPEEGGTRYEIESSGEIGAVHKEESVEVESLERRRQAQQQYNQEVLAAYDERIRKAEDNKIKQERLIRERKEFAAKANEEMKQMEDELARKRIKEQGSFAEQTRFAFQEVTDQIETNTKSWAQAAQDAAETIQSSLGNALSDFIKGSKTAGEAWQSFVDSILGSMAEALASSIAKDFMRMGTSLFNQEQGAASGGRGGWFQQAAMAGLNYAGSYFDTGGILPEDIQGVGSKSGKKYNLHEGEEVTPEDDVDSKGGVSENKSEVKVRNINVMDPSVVNDYLSTTEGEQVVVNIMQRNKDVVQ